MNVKPTIHCGHPRYLEAPGGCPLPRDSKRDCVTCEHAFIAPMEAAILARLAKNVRPKQ